MLRKCLFTVLILTAAAAGLRAQTGTFDWNDMLCEYSGTYDPARYSRTEIEDTHKLYQMVGMPLNFQRTVWNYSEIEGLDPAELDKEYNAKRELLLGLRLVRSEYWENARAAKLMELEQVYRLSYVTVRAYREPAVLREYEGAAECKTKYAEPIIAGGERLIDAWRSVNKDSQTRNADPDRLQREFDQQNASPDRLKFALVETMAFGWWNCANESIQYDQSDSDGSRDEEFKKLFTNVKTLGCDEPE